MGEDHHEVCWCPCFRHAGGVCGVASVPQAVVNLWRRCSQGAVNCDGKARAKADEPAGKSKRAQEFLEAFEKGDAKAVAGFWTPEGDYVDPSGRKYKGRAAIQKMYEKVFARQKGAKLTVNVSSVRPVGTEV